MVNNATGGGHRLYRCKLSDGTHMTSTDSGCEGASGAVMEASFGCTAAAGTPLSRCYKTPDHMCVTGTQCPAGYKFDGNLGNLPASGDVTLYRCRAGNTHFDSTDGACEGQKVEGALGHLTSTGCPGPAPPPPAPPSPPSPPGPPAPPGPPGPPGPPPGPLPPLPNKQWFGMWGSNNGGSVDVHSFSSLLWDMGGWPTASLSSVQL